MELGSRLISSAAMAGSLVVNGLMGLVYCVVLLYSTGPIEDLVNTPTGFPFMQIFLRAIKRCVGATLLSLTIALTAVAAMVAGTASMSRMV